MIAHDGLWDRVIVVMRRKRDAGWSKGRDSARGRLLLDPLRLRYQEDEMLTWELGWCEERRGSGALCG